MQGSSTIVKGHLASWFFVSFVVAISILLSGCAGEPKHPTWTNATGAEQHERLIRWWQDEIEGTGRVPILSVENKPEVLRFGGPARPLSHLPWRR